MMAHLDTDYSIFMIINSTSWKTKQLYVFMAVKYKSKKKYKIYSDVIDRMILFGVE